MTSARQRTVQLVVLISFSILQVGAAKSDNQLITNGSFDKWEGEVPLGWKVEIGAMNGGDKPVSEIRQIAGPALMMRGDAQTMAWKSVSQPIAVEPGETYRLAFKSRSKGVRRDGPQHNNCYVGWISRDAAGKVIAHQVSDISEETSDWVSSTVDYTVPSEASTTSVILFLSKTGLIGVKELQVTETTRAENLIRNGAFTNWTDGAPEEWDVEIGARNGGNKPLSKIEQLPDGGLMLRGGARTIAWNSLSQEVPVAEGKTYIVSFDAIVEGIRRQGRQFDNCYVGVMSFDGNGKRLDMAIEDLSAATRWKQHRFGFTPAPGAKTTKLMIFLSKTGTLKVKNLYVGAEVSERPFR